MMKGKNNIFSNELYKAQKEMKEEDCYSARQKRSGGPFNLSSLVSKKIQKYWIMTTATRKRGNNLYKNAYRWTQTKKSVVLEKCS